jgi:two-component system OmpR family sensor kinase
VIRRFTETYRRLRLGTRLALGMGVLSLVVFAVVGASLSMYMRGYLERQLNDQMKLVQITQSKDVTAYGTVQGKPYYGWYTASYEVSADSAVLRKPADVPADSDELATVAEALQASGHDPLFRTAHIKGKGTYRLRACEAEPGVVLVTAAPMDDIEDTMDQLATVQVVAFALALVARRSRSCGPPSTPCWSTSTTRWPSARRPSSGCAASSRTPRTNSVRL